MLKFICLLFIIVALGCSTMTYEREANGERVRLTHTAIGMEYQDVDLSAERSPMNFKANVKIGSASGKDSFDSAIRGMEETLNMLKAMQP